jgi:diguanylate cyclase (GGDEF)-like protein
MVHRSDGGLVAGHQSDADMLVLDRLAEGALARVAETASAIKQVSRSEPAIRNLPVSLAAVPVVTSATVVAVLLVVREEARPYADHELDVLQSLAPVVAASLENTKFIDATAARSLTDPLTGVGNRLRLDEELPGLVGADGASTALAMLDLDHFKTVNDTHGHQAGDELLRTVAATIQQHLRPRDAVYRYGGEEFCIVMPGTTESEAVDIADRLREAIAADAVEVGPDQLPLAITASLGVAATASSDAATLVQQADAALYAAKGLGRNQVQAASALQTP